MSYIEEVIYADPVFYNDPEEESKGETMANEMVKFESAKGDLVQFTAQEVKDRLCPNIEDKELALVMALCQAQHLNPFTKDVYITKFGDKPAQIVTGKEVFTKRAQANPKFDGMEAGISVAANGKLIRREGSMVLRGEELVGGWCKVYVKGYRVPMYDEVSFDEYAGRKKDGSLNSMWSSKGATMIRKVALCHALREAFPDDFQGLYGSEEMGVDELGGKDQNTASESTTAPQSDVSEPLVIDAVEVVSDETADAILKSVLEFAELCDKPQEDVWDALFAAKSVVESGATDIETMTPEQGEVALGVLSAWIEKSREAKAKTAELVEQDEGEPSKLAEEDFIF